MNTVSKMEHLAVEHVGKRKVCIINVLKRVVLELI